MGRAHGNYPKSHRLFLFLQAAVFSVCFGALASWLLLETVAVSAHYCRPDVLVCARMTVRVLLNAHSKLPKEMRQKPYFRTIMRHSQAATRKA